MSLPHKSLGLALVAGLLGSSCRSMSDPGNAPAVGAITGMSAGALVGSASGNAGAGAIIGGLLGRSSGELVRQEHSPHRRANEAMLLHELPETLRSAAHFDSRLKSEHDSLARRRATSPALETLPVRAQANQRMHELRFWIQRLEASDAALARAISQATGYPSPNLGKWLSQRNHVRSRLASLRTHQSWFKTLAS